MTLDAEHLATLITSILTLVAGIMAFFKLQLGQATAAATAETVKNELVMTKENLKLATAATETKIEAIHILVNDAHGATLRLAAGLAKRIAMMTKDVGDIRMAEDAQRAADTHDIQQRIVDRLIERPRTPKP